MDIFNVPHGTTSAYVLAMLDQIFDPYQPEEYNIFFTKTDVHFGVETLIIYSHLTSESNQQLTQQKGDSFVHTES